MAREKFKKILEAREMLNILGDFLQIDDKRKAILCRNRNLLDFSVEFYSAKK